jgi:hypothetical protein
MGRLAEAVGDYTVSLRLAPGHFKALFNRAFCYEKLDQLENALAGDVVCVMCCVCVVFYLFCVLCVLCVLCACYVCVMCYVLCVMYVCYVLLLCVTIHIPNTYIPTYLPYTYTYTYIIHIHIHIPNTSQTLQLPRPSTPHTQDYAPHTR